MDISPFFQGLFMGLMMLASGAVGWFMHNATVTNAITKVENAIKSLEAKLSPAPVTSVVAPATPVAQ